MDKKEELFLLYTKLNILLSKEHDALEKEDMDAVYQLLTQEEETVKRIDSLTAGKISYIENEKDRDKFLSIVSMCIKKRKENEEIIQKMKDALSNQIIELNHSKKALNEYFKKKIADSKFIDRMK